jgi:uncharacterized membrane protein YkvA (DUF1232 family)
MGNSNEIIPGGGGGFFYNIANHIKLVWALMRDERVNPLLKLIPFATLIYLVSPFDIPGPLDDAAVIWAGTYFFVELCPADIVEEHRDRLANTIVGKWKDVGESGEEGQSEQEDSDSG